MSLRCRWWSVFRTWSWSTGWGNKRRRWVGIIVLVRQLISSCAGDTPISSNGVLRYFSSPSNGSLFSAVAFLRMRLEVWTTLSAVPFDWGYSGELVVSENPHSSANFLNSSLNKFLNLFKVLLYNPTLSTISLMWSKYANTSALVMTDFSLSKASCCGFSHTNVTSFWVSYEIGSCRLSLCSMNLFR